MTSAWRVSRRRIARTKRSRETAASATAAIAMLVPHPVRPFAELTATPRASIGLTLTRGVAGAVPYPRPQERIRANPCGGHTPEGGRSRGRNCRSLTTCRAALFLVPAPSPARSILDPCSRRAPGSCRSSARAGVTEASAPQPVALAPLELPRGRRPRGRRSRHSPSPRGSRRSASAPGPCSPRRAPTGARSRIRGLARSLAVLADSSAVRYPLRGSVGRVALVATENGSAVIALDGLGRAPEGRAYRVWVVAPGSATPVADVEFSGSERVVPLERRLVKGTRVAVTLEPRATSVSPSRPLRLSTAGSSASPSRCSRGPCRAPSPGRAPSRRARRARPRSRRAGARRCPRTADGLAARDGHPDEAVVHPLEELRGVLRGRLGHDHRELVAADATADVDRADLVPQSLRDLGEDGVAGEVPDPVVDRLEVVEVEDRSASGGRSAAPGGTPAGASRGSSAD